MAKDTRYFSHDYNSRNDIKIRKLLLKHGQLGYGIFWSIVEDLYNNANALPTDYEMIAGELRADINIVKSVICDFALFVVDGGNFGSTSVESRLAARSATSDNARASANARWAKEREKQLKDANALPSQSDSNAINKEIDTERKKEIEIPVTATQSECDSESLEVLINRFNLAKKNAKYKPIEKLKTKWKAAKKDGYKVDDIISALTNAMKSDHHIKRGFKDLSPEFFLRTDKLEYWLNAKETNSNQYVHTGQL